MSRGIYSNVFMNQHEVVLPPSPCMVGLSYRVVIHNERDGVCAMLRHQGDISENGQRYIQLSWSAETVGGSRNATIANDWVTYGSLEYLEA